MKVLITGGKGFLGKRLVILLKDEYSADVHVLVRHTHEDDDNHVHVGDITNVEDMSRVFNAVRPEWVFHLAGDIQHGTEATRLAELFETNVRGTLNVLTASAQVGVSAFISAGSFEEYGDAPTPFEESREIRPVSPYGTTKAMATLLVTAQGNREATLPAAALRFPVLYGNGGHETFFLERLKNILHTHGEIAIPKERIEREFLHVDDAARALVRAAERIALCRGEVVNICTGEPIALRDVVRMAEEICGERISVVEGVARSCEQFAYTGSTTKATHLLEFEPQVSFADGLRAFLLDIQTEHE